MKAFAWVLLSAALLAAKDNAVTRPEAQDGWILLFDGESLFGWNQDGRKWRVADGALTCDAGDCGLLRSDAVFSDYLLKFDFRATNFDSDAGLLFRFAKEGPPRETGYELRLGDADGKWPSGSVAQHFRSENGKPAPNQWHMLELEANGDQLSVKIDGRKIASGKDPKSRAGFLAFECIRGGRYDFRNVKLKPNGMKPLFNGSDLSGWKAVNPTPAKPASGGMFKKLGKVFGGGGAKPHDAAWSVAGGSIHAEKGPGQLETQTAYDDFVLQLDVRANAKNKKQPAIGSINFRGDAGQLGSGYEVSIENSVSTGNLESLKTARKVLGSDNEFFTATIAARARHIQIWINGYPVTEFDDTRPEGTSPKKEARTTGGPISIWAPEGEATFDYQGIRIAALPKTLGGQAGKVAAAAPPPVVLPPTPVASLPQQAQPQQPPQPAVPQVNPGQAQQEAKQAQVSKLMQQALKGGDPKQQMDLYEKILALDPANVNAAQGYKEAQQKIEQASAQQQKTAEEKAKQSEQENQKAATLAQALSLGEAAFLKGDIATAQSQLDVAQRIAPGNPQVQNLKGRIDGIAQSRDRVKYLVLGGGLLAALSAIGLFVFTRGRKDPYIEIIDGVQKGKKFDFDQEVVHIGAVAQDGGAKNEIVLQDLERLISRFHCEIHQKDGKLYLVDCNSSNGTTLDKKRVAPGKPVRLKSGSRVELGGACALRIGFEKRKK